MILLGTVAIFAYATIKPLVAMTGQVVPRLAVSAAGTANTAEMATVSAGGPAAAPPPVTGSSSGVTPQSTGTPFQLPSLQRKQRVNFLLLGSDTDLKFAAGTYLTQSMIVVTVDPISHTVGMLSIPRDLWVRIPGYGYGKIQIAYEIGGIATARATIEQNFGIPIDYYAWIGLQGFQKMIDTVGGVNMDLAHPVLDHVGRTHGAQGDNEGDDHRKRQQQGPVCRMRRRIGEPLDVRCYAGVHSAAIERQPR